MESTNPTSTSTSMNLEEKSLCPCTRCKYQVSRKRRICNEHVKKWGVFSIEHLEPLLGGANSHASNNEALDLQPEWRARARGSTMQSNLIHKHPKNKELLEANMDDMIDAFYITNHVQEAKPNSPSHIQEPKPDCPSHPTSSRSNPIAHPQSIVQSILPKKSQN